MYCGTLPSYWEELAGGGCQYVGTELTPEWGFDEGGKEGNVLLHLKTSVLSLISSP